MLRRPPTTITLTPEDLASYTDRRLAQQTTTSQTTQNPSTNSQNHPTIPQNSRTPVDPNDELKPLPADRARVRSGVGPSAGVGGGREREREREGRVFGRWEEELLLECGLFVDNIWSHDFWSEFNDEAAVGRHSDVGE